jgi:AAA domain/UvrD-like helicase C-terminal domain
MNLIPTTEQQNIIDLAVEGSNLSIQAFAGAAKTSTCVMIAKAIKKPSIYLAFNKSIATEAAERFPFHVDCRTLHSLAYEKIIKPKYKLKNKLQGWFNKNDINIGYLEASPDANRLKQVIVNAITSFCQSEYLQLEDFLINNEDYQGDIASYIKEYWLTLIYENHPAKITHDVYLKLFHQSEPILDCDVIYLDEAQDSNPVTLNIVMMQEHCQKIIVGDKYQSIYAWRGAVNAFEHIEQDKSFKQCFLTTSFRFTQEIADKATSLIKLLGEDKKIIGLGRAGIDAQSRFTKATIVRTNSTILSYLLQAYEEDKKVYCLADLKDLFSKMYHISALRFDEKVKFPNSELVRFKNYKQLLSEAEHDVNLGNLLNITSRLANSGGLHSTITKLKSVITEDVSSADFTLTTAHKSKGLEWDEVTLSQDMLIVKEDETLEGVLFEVQCLELLYVALTRAKYRVNLPENINYLIKYGV